MNVSRLQPWLRLIGQGAQVLRDAGVSSSDVNARLLAEYIAGAQPEIAPYPDQYTIQRYDAAIAQRCAGIPLQHITGTMYFRYLELVSRPGCFIVRPETELVAQAAIDAARTALSVHGSACVVDLCTGSGAIALSVATELPGTRVYGVEISPEALAVATVNNAKYGSVVTLVRGDARTALPELAHACDVVVANPPYVPPTANLPRDVVADPPLALWGGGKDGLELPRQLVARAAHLLRPRGILVMEHAEEQGEALRSEALETGFQSARTGVDLAGRARWLWAQWKD